MYLAAGLPIEGKTVLDARGGAPSQADEEAGVSGLMDDETGMSTFVRPNDSGRMDCHDYSAVRECFFYDVDEETSA